ncbi:DnaJ domain-containing protein [Treponema sp. R6D11]
MWIVIFVFFGPIIYLLVHIIVDSISEKINEYKRDKYYEKEEIFNVSEYNNNNITENDIMLLFISQFRLHKSRYYCVDYEVYNDKDEQNYAWSVRTIKETFGWGVIYSIRFDFSNGCVYLSFSGDEFISRGKSSKKYYLSTFDFGTGDIEKTLDICREESRIKWKMNGMEPDENLPFNFIPLLSSSSSSGGYRSKNQEEKTSYENTNQSDLLSFYRNLLGLRLRFSLEELKKSYHEAVRKYHPDRYSSSSQRDRANAEMLMKQVNEAYEKLRAVAR